MLLQHHDGVMTLLRQDLDRLVDHAAFVFSKDCEHFVDFAPGMAPTAMETATGEAPELCRVDIEGAATHLGALRDAKIWPASLWKKTLGDVVEKLAAFREPEYDDSERYIPEARFAPFFARQHC